MKETYINHKYQIAVCGGGFAGISAALAAARQGKKVILFEKQYMLGGLGTAGLVTIYLPMCDGMGHQVSFGIAEELLRLSIRYGAEALYPSNWLDGVGSCTEHDRRFEVQYNPQIFAVLVEQLLLDNGVDILYGSYVVDADTEDGFIRCLFVENKVGRTAYYVDSVVDATGDCDIAHYVGAQTEEFSQGNVPAAWYYFSNKSGYHLQQVGACDIPDEECVKGKENRYAGIRFKGLNEEELTNMVCLSHKTLLSKYLICVRGAFLRPVPDPHIPIPRQVLRQSGRGSCPRHRRCRATDRCRRCSERLQCHLRHSPFLLCRGESGSDHFPYSKARSVCPWGSVPANALRFCSFCQNPAFVTFLFVSCLFGRESGIRTGLQSLRFCAVPASARLCIRSRCRIRTPGLPLPEAPRRPVP